MPLEIKAAKAAYKNAMRKLAQLEMRKKLEEHTLNNCVHSREQPTTMARGGPR